MIHLSENLPPRRATPRRDAHTRTQYIDQWHTAQAFTRVFARDLALSVGNVHSLECYRDRRSRKLQFLPNVVCYVAPGTFKFIRDRQIFIGHRARAQSVQHTCTRGNRPFGTTSETTNYTAIAEGPSPDQVTAAATALHRDITSTRNRDVLFSFFPPKTEHEFSHRTSRVALSCSRTCFGEILFRFVDPCCFHVARRRICYLCFHSDRMLRKYFPSSNCTNKKIFSFQISSTQNILQNYFAVTQIEKLSK